MTKQQYWIIMGLSLLQLHLCAVTEAQSTSTTSRVGNEQDTTPDSSQVTTSYVKDCIGQYRDDNSHQVSSNGRSFNPILPAFNYVDQKGNPFQNWKQNQIQFTIPNSVYQYYPSPQYNPQAKAGLPTSSGIAQQNMRIRQILNMIRRPPANMYQGGRYIGAYPNIYPIQMPGTIPYPFSLMPNMYPSLIGNGNPFDSQNPNIYPYSNFINPVPPQNSPQNQFLQTLSDQNTQQRPSEDTYNSSPENQDEDDDSNTNQSSTQNQNGDEATPQNLNVDQNRDPDPNRCTQQNIIYPYPQNPFYAQNGGQETYQGGTYQRPNEFLSGPNGNSVQNQNSYPYPFFPQYVPNGDQRPYQGEIYSNPNQFQNGNIPPNQMVNAIRNPNESAGSGQNPNQNQNIPNYIPSGGQQSIPNGMYQPILSGNQPIYEVPPYPPAFYRQGGWP